MPPGSWPTPPPPPPPQPGSLPRRGAPSWPACGEGVGWDQGWGTAGLPAAPPQAVCVQGCHGRGWHCRDPQPGWAPAVAQSLQGPMGGRAQGRCQAPGQHKETGASMLPAWAAGSHGTRHKHLRAHVCTCVSLADTVWARMWRTWARTYRRYPGAVQAASWYAPCHTPLHPVVPLGGCGCSPRWPGTAQKAGRSRKQHGHSPALLPAPRWGRRLGST